MNKTTIKVKHDLSSVVCDAGGAILNPEMQISKAGTQFGGPTVLHQGQDFLPMCYV